MSWLNDLATYLAGLGFGTLGTTITVLTVPLNPPTLLALVPYGGSAPERTHSGTERRHPRFQVISRAADPEVAWTRAHQARSALRGLTQQAIGSVQYETVEPVGEPLPLLNDPNGLTMVACSFEVRFH